MPNWKGNNWEWEEKNINSKRHLLTHCHIPVFHVSFTYDNLSFVQEKCQSRFLCRRQGFWNGMCVFLSSSLSSLLPPFFLPSLPSLLASFLPSLLPSLAFVKKCFPITNFFHCIWISLHSTCRNMSLRLLKKPSSSRHLKQLKPRYVITQSLLQYACFVCLYNLNEYSIQFVRNLKLYRFFHSVGVLTEQHQVRYDM